MKARKFSGQPLDDSKGGSPLIMAYIDDVNALIPTCNAEVYLQLFKKYGAPLGAFATRCLPCNFSLLPPPFLHILFAEMDTAMRFSERNGFGPTPKMTLKTTC